MYILIHIVHTIVQNTVPYNVHVLITSQIGDNLKEKTDRQKQANIKYRRSYLAVSYMTGFMFGKILISFTCHLRNDECLTTWRNNID